MSRRSYFHLVNTGGKYIDLQGIESVGTQHINLNFSDSMGFVGKVKFELTGITTGCNAIGGLNKSGGYKRSYCSPENGKWSLGIGNNYPSISDNITINTLYDIEWSTLRTDTHLIVNGATKYSTTHMQNVGSNIWMFNTEWHLNTAMTNSGKMKVYGNPQLYDHEGSLVRDLLPVILKETGEAGLVDRKNDVFYPSIGAGPFLPIY